INPLLEPLQNVVVEPDRDPGLSGRDLEDRSAPALAEIIFPLHRPSSYCRRSRRVATDPVYNCTPAGCLARMGAPHGPFTLNDTLPSASWLSLLRLFTTATAASPVKRSDRLSDPPGCSRWLHAHPR